MDNPSEPKNAVVRRALSLSLYLSAAAGASGFWLTGYQLAWPRSAMFAISIPWLLLLAPMLFVFAYPRFVLAGEQEPNRSRFAVIARIAFVFWPCWLVAALVFTGKLFEWDLIGTAFCFLCLIAAVLFAFAASTVAYRPSVAHAMALTAVVSLPGIGWRVLETTAWDNDWIIFNLPDTEPGFHSASLLAILRIVSVGLIVVAISTAALRLIPSQWKLLGRLRESTWPAFAVCLSFLALWFVWSVVPYRIPVTMDGVWSTLEILHVEKHGLQFHEACISIFRDDRIYMTENHRRLLQYRFVQTASSGEVSEGIHDRVQTIVRSTQYKKNENQTIPPIRAWDADNWYFRVEDSPILEYTSRNGTAPPAEVVKLFNDLEAAPRSALTQYVLKDVCLGFCYDPLAGLGRLYANERCHYEGGHMVCR